MQKSALPIVDRFWAKVDKSAGLGPDGECWEWTAAIDNTGYGAFGWFGSKRNTHRIAYELTHGPIARNMDIMHTCDNRKCVNPAHLKAGTRLENVRDAMSKNRHVKGSQVGTSKLNEHMVVSIRKLVASGCSCAELARLLSVDARVVEDAAAGRSWKHVQP